MKKYLLTLFAALCLCPAARADESADGPQENWVKVNDGKDVTFSYLDWSYNPYTAVDPIERPMYNLEGTDIYRVENFMNTEMDFTFELQESPYEAWKGYCRIVPVDYQAMTVDYECNSYYNDWWFADAATDNWPVYVLTSGGEPLYYYWPTYYWYDNASETEYCNVRRQGTENSAGKVATVNTAYMGCYAYTDEECSAWTPYLRLTFKWKDAGDAGVAGVEEETNARARYYNLQGARVASPQNGLYIRVQGGKVSKVLLK